MSSQSSLTEDGAAVQEAAADARSQRLERQIAAWFDHCDEKRRTELSASKHKPQSDGGKATFDTSENYAHIYCCASGCKWTREDSE